MNFAKTLQAESAAKFSKNKAIIHKTRYKALVHSKIIERVKVRYEKPVAQEDAPGAVTVSRKRCRETLNVLMWRE